MRFAVVVLVVACGIVLGACEKPGASHVTSPSALTLLGTTEGEVVFGVDEAAPASIAEQPEGWQFVLENARFGELEDGAPAIQVVNSVDSEAGLEMQVWISDSTGTLARWSGGETREYSGTVCFQLRLESEGSALGFPGDDPVMTIAFVDPASGEAVVAESIEITSTPPEQATTMVEGSDVMVDLLGCPRSVI